jgi:WD40 repeat protein
MLLLVPTLLSAADTNVRTFKGHQSSVMAVAFSPEGRILASSSRDGTIRLWIARTGDLERTLADHTADVYAVAFSQDGALLASGSGDKTIKLRDVRTGEVTHTLEGHTDHVRSTGPCGCGTRRRVHRCRR